MTGGNATLILAAVELASLTLSISANASRWERLSSGLAPVLSVGLMLAIVALVVLGPKADALLGIVGFGAGLVDAGLNYGAAGALAVLIMAMLLIVVLGFVRGFMR